MFPNIRLTFFDSCEKCSWFHKRHTIQFINNWLWLDSIGWQSRLSFLAYLSHNFLRLSLFWVSNLQLIVCACITLQKQFFSLLKHPIWSYKRRWLKVVGSTSLCIIFVINYLTNSQNSQEKIINIWGHKVYTNYIGWVFYWVLD